MKILAKTQLLGIAILMFGGTLCAQSGPYQYNPLTPCRVVDTRGANSTNGGPILGQGVERDFQIRGNCGVPVTAKAVTLNVTVTNATQGSWLVVWPSGIARPFVSTINFDPSTAALANGAVVPLSANAQGQDLAVLNCCGLVHVIVDVTGCFQ